MSTATGRPTAPSLAQSTWLVAEREIGSKLRSRAFLVATAILLAFALGGVIWGGLSAAHPSHTTVAVTAQTAPIVAHLPAVESTAADSADAAVALVRAGKADAAVVPDPSAPLHVKVVALKAAPDALVEDLSVAPRVQLLHTGGQNEVLRYLVAVGFGIVFLMSASMFGGTIAQSVVEEKQTRVVEILLSTIPARALMAGKVIGNTLLAMAQIVVLVAIALIGLAVTGQGRALAGLGGPLVWFAVFFLFGFILLASLFAGSGAMVSRQEDIGATTMPITMLIVAPYVLVIVFNDNPVVLAVMSYVPFSAPVAMPLRLYLGEAAWWEPVASLVILVATCAAAVLVGSRIYRNSLLRMGGRVRLAEALRG